ncbi:hypothetical protein MMC34_003916 [Xylographa carneopallida]|nr:hypothetical protein [Xylographa carneopallida]
MTTAVNSYEALQAEAVRSTDPKQKADLLARAKAGVDQAKKQSALEMESINQQIATERDLEMRRGSHGFQSFARVTETPDSDKHVRDLVKKHESEKHRLEMEVQRLKLEAELKAAESETQAAKLEAKLEAVNI